jgi:16S rRNA (guanine527-N7)-methyltransferase
MDTQRMAELLRPYLAEEPSPALLEQLQRYLDLLLRWNARINLTAVRNPEQIVTRHFGESLFAARVLLNGLPVEQTFRPASNPSNRGEGLQPRNDLVMTLADVGSGAGFPGIPIKLFAPQLELTLIESQNKKATFLREAVRVLGLDSAEVFCGRAEQWGKTADLVTLRAVEQFERALTAAARLVAIGGKLGLLIGTGQIPTVQETLSSSDWTWHTPNAVPQSTGRVVLMGNQR